MVARRHLLQVEFLFERVEPAVVDSTLLVGLAVARVHRTASDADRLTADIQCTGRQQADENCGCVDSQAPHLALSVRLEWNGKKLVRGRRYATEPFGEPGALVRVVSLWMTDFADHIPAAASSMRPLMNFAKTHGLHPKLVGQIWTFAAGGKLFAYQNAVLEVWFSFGYFRGRDLIRLDLLLCIAEFIFLVPTVLFYWQLLGLQ